MDENKQDRKVFEPDAIIPPVSGGYVYFKPPPPPRRWINYTLFAVTFVTTLLAGTGQEGVTIQELASNPLAILRGLPFSLTLMGILLAHEMGHFMMARRHGVDATLPYFIPAPFGIGTFGAVIKMRSPLRSRNALIDIGAAGPIAGMLVAIPASYIGLVLSDVKPVTEAMSGGLMLGDSLIMRGMQYLIHGPLKPGYDVFLHPVAFAGWIGMLVTMLNLLPVGQLDGGHISYAVFGPNAVWVSRITFLTIVLLAVYAWYGWITWALLILFVIRLRHPPIYEPVPTRLDAGRTAVAAVALVLFVLTFMPSPISGV